MLEIENLDVAYGRFSALEAVNLNVLSGKTFGLIGLNGAGKTTLIKTILGLRHPLKGRISFFDSDGSQLLSQNAKKHIAYLPERFEPPVFLSGREFIRFSGTLYQKKISEAEMDEAAKSLELDSAVLSRSVNTYSKGMRQKLGLIATILTGCQFLILDEPMSGLDPKARVCVKENIVRLREEGRTVFLSSHILSDLHEICDTVAVLHNKTIQFYGSPDDLMKQYNKSSLERAFLEVIKKEKVAA
jgi:ABC-2 type transport system ATP-binding protein